jgi:nucleotide-binding universal stress UspA family protein
VFIHDIYSGGTDELAQQIVSTANSEKVDTIFVGARGLTGVKSLLLGSVSKKVVEKSDCNVTVVKL